MATPIRIDPDAFYDDNAADIALGFSSTILKRGRDREGLRFTRKGQRNLYKGRWLLDWLSGDAASAEVAPEEMAVS